MKWASVAPILAFLLCLCGAVSALASGTIIPSVQNYAEQAVPITDLPPQDHFDSPLAAGTLTLQDVLEAHKVEAPVLPSSAPKPTASSTATAPILTAPQQSSTTSLMMSQGMKAVLQKVGETAVATPPASTRLPKGVAPASAVEPVAAQAAPASLLPAVDASGVKYEAGRGPKNLASGVADDKGTVASGANPATTADAVKAASGGACDENTQKWEKSCGEVGYPSTYVGKIVGETRTGCSDGALHDFWVTNSCAPPDALSGTTPSTNAVCGVASNNEFDTAPSANLCAQGVPSAVSGDGPWNWACSGVNGGEAVACSARQRVPVSNGKCGAANGQAATTAPSGDLCASGFATQIKGSGPWNWTCKGMGGGGSETCIAPAVSVARAAAAVATVENDVKAAAPVEVVTSQTVATKQSVASDKGEFCGAAAETLAYEAPDRDLCRVGSASVVNGDGPWTWSCTDNEGRSSSCRTLSLKEEHASAPAAETPVAALAPAAAAGSPRLQPAATMAVPVVKNTELACGLSASQPALQAPDTHLCENGKASAVRGSGPWRWSCAKGRSKIACETPKVVDAMCGPANGQSLKSAPFAGLCAVGTPTGIQGNGPWAWSCNGSGGGVTVSCAATVQDKVDGACGSSATMTLAAKPAEDLCASGSASAVSGDGPWRWSCSGSGGGAASSCAATKAAAPLAPGPKVDGLCGAANGMTTSSRPAEALCASGAPTKTVGDGPWNWNCIGANGGMTVSCTAPLEPPAPVDGICGPASGVPTLVVPQSGLCVSGITGLVSGKGPWNWTCSGANGGNPASCVAPVAGKTGAMSSAMIPADVPESVDSDTNTAAPPAFRSGLTTPRLPTPTPNRIPSLDKKTLPSLTTFRPLTTPTVTPAVPSYPADVYGDVAPSAAPALQEGSSPVPPPAIRDRIASAPVLQNNGGKARLIPGNHLTLDPTLSTILFTHGSDNIDDQVVPNLDRLVGVLSANSDVRITLTSYADNVGSTPREARRLSLNRALAVRTYLSSQGIEDSRIDVRAEGANTTSGYIDRVDVRVND